MSRLLADNLNKVQEKIEGICIKSGRNVNDVKIIAVTKYVDVEKTKEILDLGIEHIGENRVKEGTEKYEALKDRGTWHFIGTIQSRKVKQVIDKFDYIHSLDRLSLAEEIDKRAKQLNKEVKCFVQVNVSGEASKSGVAPEQLVDFIKEIAKFKTIHLTGLMTMAPLVDDKEETRDIFRKLRGLLELINSEQLLDYQFTELSMGMSNDYEIAIEEGATFVRLGTVIFGG